MNATPLIRAERKAGGGCLTPSQGWKKPLNDFTMGETGTAALEPYPAGCRGCSASRRGAALQRAANSFLQKSTERGGSCAQVEVERCRGEQRG